MERRRATRAANEEEARGRAVKAATRPTRASKEIMVATWNTRTMAEKGRSNGIGHAETLLRRARRAGCDIVGLQETRRSLPTSFQAAGYTVFCSGGEEGKGTHGVGLAVCNSIVSKKGYSPEPIYGRMTKVRLNLSGKSNAVTAVVAYAPTLVASKEDKSRFWGELSESVKAVLKKDHLFLLMDANARTGTRDQGGGGK